MVKKVLGVYVVWLVIINLFAIYALNRFNLKPDTSYSWLDPQQFYQDQKLDLVSLRIHWDSFWYIKIAKIGYEYVPKQMSSIAFFPLYPALMWTLSYLTTIDLSLSGWIISIISLAVGLIFLYKLVKENHSQIDPLLVIGLLLIFPSSFFLTSVYTESLFLSLSIIFFYYLLKKQFIYAAIFLSLCCLCRVNGLFLFAPFIYEYFKLYGFRKFFNLQLLSFLIAPLGIISFTIYEYIKFQEPLAFLKSQMEWGRKFVFNAEHFQLISPSSYSNLATDLLFLIVGITCSILLMRYVRLSYGLYCLITLIIPVLSGTLMSISRYSLILFPIFILIASSKNKIFIYAWVILSTLLLASYTILFVNNYWAG